MELIDIKVTFTESTEYNLKNLSRFNEKSLEEKVKNLNDANRRARKTLRGAYDKTDVILILADGTEHRMRFETPGFGEHRHGCPCHDMTEEEYDEDDGESCRCEDIAHEEAEDARVDAMLSRMEDY